MNTTYTPARNRLFAGLKGDSLKILWFFFKDQKRGMLSVLMVMVISGILETLNLAALYPLINHGLKVDNQNTIGRFLDTLIGLLGKEDLFSSACIFLIIVTSLSTAAMVLYQYFSNQLIKDIVAENQKAIFNKFLTADHKYFVKSQQGRLVYAGTIAPLGVSKNVLYAIRIFQSTISCLFFVFLMLLLAWQGMAVMLLLGALYVFFIRGLLNRIINKFAHLFVEEDQKKNVMLNELITGIKTIKAFGHLKYWQEKYTQLVDKSMLFRFKVMMGRSLPDSFLKCIFFMAIAVLGLALSRIAPGEVIFFLPAMGTFVAAASRLVPYINLIGSDILTFAHYMPDCKVVYDVLNEPMRHYREGTKTLDAFRERITFERVSFHYEGMTENVLDNLSFSIPKNQVTAIVGASGEGKSTIVSLLLGLYRPNEGSIKMDGIDICELTDASYLSKIGFVSQETFLFNGSIRDNICFGDDRFSEHDIREAAQLASAHDFILATEHGYDSIVGDAGVKLSGGQRQRIAIARAILRKPEILILDEATSSLDNISERAIQEAINTIAKKTTVLIIAHRMSTVQNADKIIVLEKGKIVEEGRHEDLLTKREAYFSLYAS